MVKKYFRFGAMAGAIVLLDQVTKALVLLNMQLHQTIAVIPGFFNLTHVRNPGGAFGFMAQSDSPLRHWFFWPPRFLHWA